MEIYLDAYNRARKMLIEGFDSSHVLSYLTTSAEFACPGTVASILRIDAEGLLRNCASPKLPADYLLAIVD